jgi:hypothetical protein
MTSQHTRDVCAKRFGFLTAEPETDDPAEALALMRKHYEEVAPTAATKASSARGRRR